MPELGAVGWRGAAGWDGGSDRGGIMSGANYAGAGSGGMAWGCGMGWGERPRRHNERSELCRSWERWDGVGLRDGMGGG